MTPGPSQRFATAGPRCRTRARSCSSSRWPAADVEGEAARARAVARPLRRPGRQGRAAGGPRHRATDPVRGQRDQRAPCRPRLADPGGRTRRGPRARHEPQGASRRRSRARRARAGRLQPRPHRCAVHGSRGPATTPEARWRRGPGDVAALAGLQRELLASGIEATATGGLVGYATCSPHLNETRFVVTDILKRRDDVELRRRTPALRRRVRSSAAGSRRRALRPALAARPRHRRDVLRPAAQAVGA